MKRQKRRKRATSDHVSTMRVKQKQKQRKARSPKKTRIVSQVMMRRMVIKTGIVVE